MGKKFCLGQSEGYMLYNDIKNKVIDYLYSKINLSKHRFIILDTTQKLKFLQETQHYVSPNFKGYSYLLMMMTIDNKRLCVAINRKKLSYHKEQLDLKNVCIIQIQMNINDAFYNGTIFDGKLIQNTNESIFLVQDCFYLMGKNMLNVDMKQKTEQLDELFKNNFNKTNNYCSNFNFKLNKLYSYADLSTLIYDVLPTLQIPLNGIVFTPQYSGINVVHIENKNEKVSINTTTTEVINSGSFDIINSYVDFLKNRTYSYENDGKFKQLLLARTEIPDVYNLCEKDNNTKLGIAHIPSLKISHYCDSVIKNTPVLFNCVYNTKFKKWIPINKI